MLKSVRSNRSQNRIQYPSCDTSDVIAIYLQPHDAVCFLWTHGLAGRSTITLHARPHPLGRQRNLIADYARLDDGAVAEWTKATALKVVDPQGFVGSNPTRSASLDRNGGVAHW